jgi:hypothetical protein
MMAASVRAATPLAPHTQLAAVDRKAGGGFCIFKSTDSLMDRLKPDGRRR